MVWFVYSIVSLYSLLTIIAAISQLISKGFHMNHLIFITLSSIMFLSLFIETKEITIAVLIIAFIGIHTAAVIAGMTINNRLTLGHHIVRLVLHIIIVVMALLFIN